MRQRATTLQTAEFLVNALTSENRDPATCTPDYKVTSVRLERVAENNTFNANC